MSDQFSILLPAPLARKAQADASHCRVRPDNVPPPRCASQQRKRILPLTHRSGDVSADFPTVCLSKEGTCPESTRQGQKRFLPAPSASSEETLIIIAPYQSVRGAHRSAIHLDIMQRLHAEHQALQAEINAPMLNLRLVEAPHALNSEDCSAARSPGQRVGAALVIWGRVCSARVTTCILNLRRPDAAISSSAIEGARLAAPQAFTRHVAGDVQEMTMYASFSILGDAYYNAREYAAAMRMLERAVAHLPATACSEGAAQIFFRLGWLYQMSGNHLTQAVAAYTRAIALNPNNPVAYYNRGIAHAEQGSLAQAISDYTHAIDLDPKYIAAYYHRALARYEQGDLAGAIADYNSVLLLDPADAKVYASRGMARYSQGDLAGAFTDFDRTLLLYRDLTVAYVNRGIAHYLRGDRQRALADFERARALTRDPQHQKRLNERIAELRQQSPEYASERPNSPLSRSAGEGRGVRARGSQDVANIHTHPKNPHDDGAGVGLIGSVPTPAATLICVSLTCYNVTRHVSPF